MTRVFPEAIAAGRETKASREKAIAAHIVPTVVVILTPNLSRKLFALVAKEADLVMSEAYSRRLSERSIQCFDGGLASISLERQPLHKYHSVLTLTIEVLVAVSF
jgi:hypothetical protein